MRNWQAIRSPLFARMLRRALTFRRSHTGSALLALTVAAGVSTAMLGLYLDLEAKLHKEFRTYGANIVINTKDGQPMPQDALAKVEAALPAQALAVPFAYAIAHTEDGTPVVVAGTDFAGVKKLDRWWSVCNWPSAPGEALVGERARRSLGDQSSSYTLYFGNKPWRVNVAGTLKTGAEEEDRIYISLPEFEGWTGLRASSIEISVPGSRQEIHSALARLGAALPRMEVRPVRQIVEAETAVISKTKLLMFFALLLIGITVTLCVVATLTSSVLERRRDFAIMKALGSSQMLLNLLFTGEAACLGVAGALAGYILGSGLAAWIGRVNFHATVLPSLALFPLILGGTIGVALLASLFPLSRLQHVQPAGILKGE